MKEIIKNEFNINETEVTDNTTKAKLLYINSNNEILLAHSRNDYEFPGGTQEIGEDILDTVKREIMEETGIDISNKEIKEFVRTISYYKDWPEVNRNKKIVINYFILYCDDLPDLSKIKLTDDEKSNSFKISFISMNEVFKVINDNIIKYGDTRGIGRDMLEILEVYKNLS